MISVGFMVAQLRSVRALRFSGGARITSLIFFCLSGISLAIFPAHAQNEIQVSAVVPQSEMSVKKAIELARTYNTQLKRQQLAIQRQQLNADLADANYKSDFDVQLSSTRSDVKTDLEDYDTDSRRTVNSASLLVTLPWWYKAEYKFDERIARVGEALESNNYDRQYRRLDVDIYIAYFDAVLQKNKIHVQKTLAEISKQRLDNTQKSFDLGRASKWTRVNDESNYLTQLAALNRAESEFLQKMSILSNFVGVPFSEAVNFSDAATLPDDLALDRILSFSPDLESDPGLKQLRLQLDQKELELKKIAKTTWKPRLTMKAVYLDDSQYDLESDPDGVVDDLAFDRDASQMLVGATLTVPIPTFSENRLKKTFTLQEVNDIKVNIHEFTRTRTLEIANKKTILQALRVQLSTLSKLVAKNVEEADFARQSFDIGKLTNLELQNIESLQIQSAEEYYFTLFNIRRHYAELCWLLNAPLEYTR